MKKLRTFGIIFIGASIGGILRYLISLLFINYSSFPWGTIFVNLTGAFVLPLLIHYLHDRFHLSAGTVLSLTTGLLGSYTTFSTMSADAVKLFLNSDYLAFGLYLIITMVGGFLLALFGNYLAVYFADKELEKN
ncbi:fluoride efflux transporter FluC [Companilactobacillus sp.]|jgi:CrcB protein|uniref:fluoride efflux transporter FluC n=1 Tax=Companilactobacillus sp. TaxID=2767905 RepID=UPI0025BFA3E7|nr:CrcB family protein [Companilactobacillus sp.]MCH4008988.1 CrcB family protein [Companilactobacillus sp.]MCH4050833.1 CrcB family protein [Companilactobacillus sp.]MCH4076931.1 CrcB family protein [Companilactobacillus sp.]MCH4125506.1 CrcB family protein [Companilactobacillus sp.]MCI1311215.1 CrcB family protein [Companilactobacillus sp.]